MASQATGFSAESIVASGRGSEKLSLPLLQSKMKCDPEGYESELATVYSQFKSFLEMFKQQAAFKFTSISGVGNDPTVAKDLGDWAMFLAHVTPFYRKKLAEFPNQLAELLRSSARTLPSGLRCHLVQALILLINRKILDTGENLALFMELQTLGDRNLKKLAFSHVVQCIRRMNQKHKNEAKNRGLQNIIFPMLQQEDEAKAKRAFITLCELHRRKVWFDDRTANAICTACNFYSSSRIMIASLSVLLDYEKIEDEDDSDASSDEDEKTPQAVHAVISRQSVYKICPSLLVKKDRGRTTDSKAKPKAYGEVNVLSNVSGVELLDDDDEDNSDGEDGLASIGFDDDSDEEMAASGDDDDEDNKESTYGTDSEDGSNCLSDSDGDVSINDDDEEDEDKKWNKLMMMMMIVPNTVEMYRSLKEKREN